MLAHEAARAASCEEFADVVVDHVWDLIPSDEVTFNDIDEEQVTLTDLEGRFKPGDRLQAMIARIEADRKKVYLSLRALNKVREKEEIKKFMKADDEAVTTIGDLLQNELDKNK